MVKLAIIVPPTLGIAGGVQVLNTLYNGLKKKYDIHLVCLCPVNLDKKFIRCTVRVKEVAARNGGRFKRIRRHLGAEARGEAVQVPGRGRQRYLIEKKCAPRAAGAADKFGEGAAADGVRLIIVKRHPAAQLVCGHPAHHEQLRVRELNVVPDRELPGLPAVGQPVQPEPQHPHGRRRVLDRPGERTVQPEAAGEVRGAHE